MNLNSCSEEAKYSQASKQTLKFLQTLKLFFLYKQHKTTIPDTNQPI